MIKIDISLAITFYLVSSILILLIWIIFERGKREAKNRRNTSLWQCPTCFYNYIDSCSENISKCPKSKTLHKKQEKM